MTSKNEHLVLDIKQASDNIRRKVNELKSSLTRKQRSFETKYKPLIDPIKTLTRRVEPLIYHVPIPTHRLETVAEKPDDYTTDDDGEVTSLETDSSVVPPVLLEDISSYIESEGIGETLGAYLTFIKTDTNQEADFTYGVHYDGEKWMMGTSPVEFCGNKIVIDNMNYEGTQGLCELIFKKVPEGYTKDDLNDYRRMLLQTNAHIMEDGVRVKSNRGHKYLHIISRLFPRKGRKFKRSLFVPSTSSTGSQKRCGEPLVRQAKEKKGEGLLVQVNSTPLIDYSSWTDPNVLVDRLYLLLASKKAGNTGHEVEIRRILEELRKAGYIKDFEKIEL